MKTLVCCLLVFLLSGCSSPNAPAKETASSQRKANDYVAYFSRTGHTRPLAEEARSFLGAPLFEITAKVPYSDADIDYGNANCRANQEQDAGTIRPEIANALPSLEGVTRLFLGYPIWWGKCPRIVLTFLDAYAAKSLTIYPFCTSASTGIEGSVSELKTLYPQSQINNGKRFAIGESVTTMDAWLTGLE